MSVRTKVVVSLINSGEVLLAEGYDPANGVQFYIPLGGGVEFGELLEDAARREVSEEVGLQLGELEYRTHIENIYVFNGTPGHEMVFHFLARIDDESRKLLPTHGVEDNGDEFPIRWFPQEELHRVREHVVPTGIYSDIDQAL